MAGELFVEKQSFRNDARWVVLVLLIAGLAPVAFLREAEEIGSLWIPVIGAVGILFVLAASYLTISVTPAEVRFVYWPFYRRTISAAQIESASPETYRPLVDYGGWGLRYRRGRGWAYSVSGNRGVRLQLADGKSLLLGSKKPEELAAAIERIIAAGRSGTNT